MDRTQIFAIIGLLVVATAAVIGFGVLSASRQAAKTAAPATTTTAPSSSDWTRDNKDGKVSVIEYGDFQCPACGAYEPIVEQLEAKYGDRVSFTFRNFPLTQAHPNAMIAAQAAGAAGLQGKFWEMHDILYKNQTTWASAPGTTIVTEFFDSYAKVLGLDVTKFNADIQSAAVKDKITADIASATAAQVDHTPTFFVNLTQIANPNYADFAAALDAALAKASK